MRQFVIVLVSKLFHVTVKYVFQGSFCALNKCSFSLTHCWVNLYCFSFAKFFKLSSKFCFFVDPSFHGTILFRNDSQKCSSRFFGIFCFNLFASRFPSNRSWWTRRYFTPLLSLDGLSTYARSMHQTSFFNLANALIFLNLRVARGNFVYEGFECQNCPTFAIGRLLAFPNLHTDPQAATFGLTIIATSDVHILQGTELQPSLALAFWFRIKVAEYQHSQLK